MLPVTAREKSATAVLVTELLPTKPVEVMVKTLEVLVMLVTFIMAFALNFVGFLFSYQY